MPATPGVVDTATIKMATATANLAQGAATYDLLTVSGGDIVLLSASFYSSVVAAGLVTAAVQTNNTTPDVLLAAVAAAVLTAGRNHLPYNLPIVLVSGKKLQYTIVGTGTGAGALIVVVRYQPYTSGGLLS